MLDCEPKDWKVILASHARSSRPEILDGRGLRAVTAQLMSTPAFLAAAVVLGLAGAFALIKHRSKKTIPRLPDAKLD